MPKSYWTKVQTPNGLKYFRADEVTPELMQKIKDEADDVFYVEYGTTTYSDALAAYNAGKFVLLLKTSGTLTRIYTLVSASSTTLRFSKVDGQLQDTVSLNSSNQYSDTHTTLVKPDNVMKTSSAEIAPEYYDLCTEYQIEHKFPIPVGTLVTYLDNTSSDVLQYLYKSKVEIYENDCASSDPIGAPAKWDKIHVSDELGKGVVYVDILQTPFADVLSLYNQGKHIVGRNGYEFYRMIGYNESWGSITGFSFQSISGPVIYTWHVRSDGPVETKNWVTPPDIYYNASIYSVASQYDETNTYSVGDVVSRYDSLYRCNTDISTPEVWTASHWTQTTVAAELKRVESSSKFVVFEVNLGLGIQYPTFNDVKHAVDSGKVPVLHIVNYNGASDSPADYFHIVNYSSAPNYHAYSFSNGKEVKTVNSSDVWSSESAYDSALNEYSTNAVQNSTLYAVIGNVEALLAAL